MATQPPRLLDQVKQRIRLRGYSILIVTIQPQIYTDERR